MQQLRSRSPSVPFTATERAKRMQAARLMARSNDLFLARQAFCTWVATMRKRKLRSHMKRCSIMLKHAAFRQQCSRCFVRWMAFTQQRIAEDMRCAIQLRQDVPLRSKADFLNLAKRYFGKWRSHLRERKQRSAANVELLETVNKERLLTHMLLRWRRFHYARMKQRYTADLAERDDAISVLQEGMDVATGEVKHLRSELAEMLQQQSQLESNLLGCRREVDELLQQHQTEVDETLTFMDATTRMLQIPSNALLQYRAADGKHTSTYQPSKLNGATGLTSSRSPSSRSMPGSTNNTTLASETLLQTAQATLATLADVLQSPAAPDSFHEYLTYLQQHLSDADERAEKVKAQRDELAASAQTAVTQLGAATASGWGEVMETSSTSYPAPDGKSASLVYVDGGCSNASVTILDFQALAQRLVEESHSILLVAHSTREERQRSAAARKRLEAAASRAIDTLGGGGTMRTDLIASSRETFDSSMPRSAPIADALEDVCERLEEALKLTSHWSGKGATKRVSVILEELWRRTHDLEDAQAASAHLQENYSAVVRTAVALLRPRAANSPLSPARRRSANARARVGRGATVEGDSLTRENADKVRLCAEQLVESGDRGPAELMELCLLVHQRAAEHISVPAGELEALFESARDLLRITVGKQKGAATGSAVGGTPVTAGESQRGNSAFSSPDLISFGHANPSEDTGVTEEVTASLRNAVTVVINALHSSDNARGKPLVEALERVQAQLQQQCEQKAHTEKLLAELKKLEKERAKEHDAERVQLQEQLRETAAVNLTNARLIERKSSDLERALANVKDVQEGKRNLAAQLREQEAQQRLTERALRKQLEELDKTRSAAERDVQFQLKAHERETARALQRCERLETELKEIKLDRAAEIEALGEKAAATQAALQEKQVSLQKQLLTYQNDNRQLLDDVERLRDALAKKEDKMADSVETGEKLADQLRAVQEETCKVEAIGVFLEDVLQDGIMHLHSFIRKIRGDTVSPSSSPRETPRTLSFASPLTLQQSGNVSDYVKHILQGGTNGPLERELVWQHLRARAVLLNNPVRGDTGVPQYPVLGTSPSLPRGAASDVGANEKYDATSSTWEVLSEFCRCLGLLHDGLTGVDDSVAAQQSRMEELVRQNRQLALDTAAALAQLRRWTSTAAASEGQSSPFPEASPLNAESESNPMGSALQTSCSEVAQALEEMERVLLPMQPLVVLRPAGSPSSSTEAEGYGRLPHGESAATVRLRTLVRDVQSVVDCLHCLCESSKAGIRALGGQLDDASELTTDKLPSPNDDHERGRSSSELPAGRWDYRQLAKRLEAICQETCTSIHEVKQLLAPEESITGFLSNSPQAQKPLKLSDVLPIARAKMKEMQDVQQESTQMMVGLVEVLDDDDVLSNSLGTLTHRSLKPKDKPWPAFQGDLESGFRLLHQKREVKKVGKTSEAAGDISSALRLTRVTLRERIRDVHDLRLACRTALQLLEGGLVNGQEKKQQLPSYGDGLVALLTTQIEDLKQVLPETEEALKGIRSPLQGVTVGTRLHLLCDTVCSLRQECRSLKDDLARRARQGNVLLNAISQDAAGLRAEVVQHQEAREQLLQERAAALDEIATQKHSAAELAVRLASLRHEGNVLCEALMGVIRMLPGSNGHNIPALMDEEHLRAALQADQGKPLLAGVEAASRAAHARHQQQQHHLRDIVRELRDSVTALREHVNDSWSTYASSIASEAALYFQETAQVLALENAMLRRRAIEREELVRNKEDLKTALTKSEDVRLDVVARLELTEDENARLRREIQDARMALVLLNREDDDDDGNDAGAGHAIKSHLSDPQLALLEQRMIEGAVELTMDAINSMNGSSMSAVFGSLVKEILRIYRGVRRGLSGIEAIYASSTELDRSQVEREVAERLRELQQLSEAVRVLSSRLPVLNHMPYQ